MITSSTLSCCVFGAAHVDRIGHIETPLKPGQSHPGHWHFDIGGVGANVARHLNHFGANVHFASCYSTHSESVWIQSSLQKQGLNLLKPEYTSTLHSPSYTAIHDVNGEVIVGLADMELYEALNQDWAKTSAAFAKNIPLWIADTNLTEDAFRTLIEAKHTSRLYVIGVSPAKMAILNTHMSKIDGLICNRKEAEALLQTSFKDAVTAARAVHDAGIKHVIISNSEYESTAIDRMTQDRANTINLATALPPKPTNLIHLTGAGDAFAAGYLYSYFTGYNNAQALQHANIAAGLCLKDMKACPKLNWEDIV